MAPLVRSMCTFGLLPIEFSVSQSTIKGIEATLAESHLKPADLPTLEAEAKAAIIIK